MAKTSFLGANIAVATDTFREWVERTNQLVYDAGTIIVTVGAVSSPNSTHNRSTDVILEADCRLHWLTYLKLH